MSPAEQAIQQLDAMPDRWFEARASGDLELMEAVAARYGQLAHTLARAYRAEQQQRIRFEREHREACEALAYEAGCSNRTDREARTP